MLTFENVLTVFRDYLRQDLEDISRRQEALWDGVHQVLTQLAKLS